jgi:large subunit ribosomal protein L32
MGAVPKRKISSMRRGNRRRYQFITPLPMGACTNCGALKPTHRACRSCGMYNGHQIIEIKTRPRAAE